MDFLPSLAVALRAVQGNIVLFATFRERQLHADLSTSPMMQEPRYLALITVLEILVVQGQPAPLRVSGMRMRRKVAEHGR